MTLVLLAVNPLFDHVVGPFTVRLPEPPIVPLSVSDEHARRGVHVQDARRSTDNALLFSAGVKFAVPVLTFSGPVCV